MINQIHEHDSASTQRSVPYEEHLARLEFSALGCHELHRIGDHWDQMTGIVNGTTDMVLARSAYLGTLDGRPSTYSELIKPQYQGGRFNRTRSVNQYLHSLDLPL